MLNLRFIELAKNNFGEYLREEVLLDFGQHKYLTIGHQGDIKPKISNGHISRIHATVYHDGESNSWLVLDGNHERNRSSKNGIYNKDGDRIESSIKLFSEGERVFFINSDNCVAYLEVFESENEICDTKGRDTAGLEIQLAHIQTKTELNSKKLTSVANRVETNLEAIREVHDKTTDLDQKVSLIASTVDQALDHVSELGSKPRQYITGALVAFFMVLLAMTSYILYHKMEKITDQLLRTQDRIEQELKR